MKLKDRTFLYKSILFLIVLSLSIPVVANEKKSRGFSGMIQFTEGESSWPKEPLRPKPTFQSIIYRQDQFKVEEGAMIKWITDNRCVDGGGHHGKRKCKRVYHTHTGHRQVSYYYSTTTVDVVLNLLAPGSNNLLAKFVGSKSDSDKIYTYKETCH